MNPSRDIFVAIPHSVSCGIVILGRELADMLGLQVRHIPGIPRHAPCRFVQILGNALVLDPRCVAKSRYKFYNAIYM